MVVTRSHSVGLLYEKAVRLRRKLKAIGLIKRKHGPVTIMFGSDPPSHVCRQSIWGKLCNPTAITFTCTVDREVHNVAYGCIHPLDMRCPACDVHPDADIKHAEVFSKKRCWIVCKLWNTDPFVLGQVELNDGA